MSLFATTGWRASVVLSLTAAAIITPEVILAGPGCMSNQRMTQGYYPYSPMWPQALYGHRAPYPYYVTPPPYVGMMAASYRRPMTAQQSRPAVVVKTITPAAVATGVRQPNQATASSKSTPVGKTVTVRIDGMRFEPASITIEPGTTVTWIHGSQMPRTVTGNTDGLRSRTLYKGQKFSHTFNSTGNYKYFCDFHPSMTGSVIVEEAGTDT